MKTVLLNNWIKIEDYEWLNALHVTFQPGLTIDLNTAKNIVEMRISACGGKNNLYSIDIRNLISIEDEARDFLATNRAVEFIEAMALITDRRFQILISNFYIRFSKPRVPTRLFSDQENAFMWLQHFRTGQT